MVWLCRNKFYICLLSFSNQQYSEKRNSLACSLWYGRLFQRTSRNFPALIENKFGFLVNQFVTFLIDFSIFKLNSTLCQIYWILDLQSLKLVCFVNTKSENMQIPDFFWQEGLLTYSYSPCRHRSKKSSKWNKLQQKVFQRNIVS